MVKEILNHFIISDLTSLLVTTNLYYTCALIVPKNILTNTNHYFKLKKRNIHKYYSTQYLYSKILDQDIFIVVEGLGATIF